MQLPTRPVIPGFHPDPSVCRVGDAYYLACSSFEYAPGVPIYRSADLRTWEQIGHALDRPSQLDIDDMPPSGGVFAPTLRHHDGRFWMITTNLFRRPGLLLVTAEDPAGPWSEPIWIDGVFGIDPDLAWDDDGTCYVTWCGIGDPGGVLQAVLEPESGKLLSEPQRLWQGTGGSHPEGPHLYHIGAYCYLLIAEGGTERGHAATIARGPSPAGPFEPCPHNPLLTARGSDSVVQNAGHADLVQTPDGDWAMAYLGVRALGGIGTAKWHILGRETFACRIAWTDGWPHLADPIEPPSSPIVTEELTPANPLPLSWVTAGRWPDQALRQTGDAWLLTPTGQQRTFAGRRQEHLHIRAQARISGSGGLELRIDPRHAVIVELRNGHARAVAHIGSLQVLLGGASLTADTHLELRTEQAPGFGAEQGPDTIVAGITGPDGFTELGRLDGRYVSTEVAGGFTGRMIGISCSDGELALHSFTYTGTDDLDALR
jgi:xylan 1,4-beta-xylosidase